MSLTTEAMNYANGEDAFFAFKCKSRRKTTIIAYYYIFSMHKHIIFYLIAVFPPIPATYLASQHSAISFCSFKLQTIVLELLAADETAPP